MFSFLMLSLTCSIDVLFEKLTPEIGGWKTYFAHYDFGDGDFMESLSSFLISLVVTFTLMPWLQGCVRFA